MISRLQPYGLRLGFAGIGMCLLSLFLPVGFSPHTAPEPGIYYLIIGIFGFNLYPSWFANPLGLIATFLFNTKNYKASAIFSGSALIIAQEGWTGVFEGFSVNEAGTNQYITWLSLGFFAWLTGIALLFVAAVIMYIGPQIDRSKPQEQPRQGD